MVLLGVTAIAETARAGPPPAARILPKSTIAYVSVANVGDFKGKLLESSWGQMSQNPQLKPLAERLFGTLDKAFVAVEKQLGASLRELLTIPQGELALAIVPQAKGPPVGVLLLDAGDHVQQADKVVGQAAAFLEQQVGGASARNRRAACSW